ncbi:MAG: MerR family transcriptional regulator [Lachnospiraceae bacterium]|nr:MerR family transcriptional regulator [Lachnospiraceae bacterium]
MGERRYELTQEDLNRIAVLASKEAIAAYKAEIKKSETKRSNEKISVTKKKLASYRRVKASLVETEEFTEEEKIDLRWKFVEDLMGSAQEVMRKSEDTILSIEKKRKRDRFEIQSIDRAMQLYAAEAERNTSEEFKRRYREIMARYIDDNEKSITEIAEEESITEKTVYKDLGIACKIVATYLLGM